MLKQDIVVLEWVHLRRGGGGGGGWPFLCRQYFPFQTEKVFSNQEMRFVVSSNLELCFVAEMILTLFQ